MAAAELEPQGQEGRQEITEVPDQPEIPKQVEEGTGVKAVPIQPQPLVQDNQVVAQPTQPASNLPSVQIPVQSQTQLDDYAKQSPNDSSRWFGVYWLRRVKRALHSGVQVIFGNKQ